MQTCRINDYSISIPQKWDELTKQQLLAIVRAFRMGWSDFEFKVATIIEFLKLSIGSEKSITKQSEVLHHFKSKKNKEFWLSDRQLVSLAHTCEFLTTQKKTKDGQHVYSLNSDLTKNLIPDFKHRLKKYFGPDDRLFNVVFEEYLEADNHFLAFSKSGEVNDLDKLVATLYREKSRKHNPNKTNYKGDLRQVFNNNLVKPRAKRISKLDEKIKWAILLYYQGCRRFLALNFPHVFDSPKGSSEKGYGPLSLIDALTGDDVTKNKAVRTSYLYDVMVRLERAAILHEKSKPKNQ